MYVWDGKGKSTLIIPLNERQVKTVVKKAQEQKIMESRKEEGGRRKEDVVQDVVTDVVPGHYCEV